MISSLIGKGQPPGPEELEELELELDEELELELELDEELDDEDELDEELGLRLRDFFDFAIMPPVVVFRFH